MVAEGVEDEETGSALRSLGCHTSQGYYLSRPLPAADFTSWLAALDIARLQPVSAPAA